MSLHSEVSRDEPRSDLSGNPLVLLSNDAIYIHSSVAVRLRVNARDNDHIGDGSVSELCLHVEASDRREHTSVTSERQTETSAPLRTPRKASPASLVDSRCLSLFPANRLSLSRSLSLPTERDPASLSLSLARTLASFPSIAAILLHSSLDSFSPHRPPL